uniref:Uncharacterized protein n=1 Tax=Acrobeloides nanus TaxID=290746 RepID=A0A914CMT6_9BILA
MASYEISSYSYDSLWSFRPSYECILHSYDSCAVACDRAIVCADPYIRKCHIRKCHIRKSPSANFPSASVTPP